MKKNYKKIFGEALVLAACVLIIVLVACISENRLDDYQEEYQKDITLSQAQVKKLEDKIDELEGEKAELQKKLDEALASASDSLTNQQALSGLKEIYEKYKSGNKYDAIKEFKKIETMGFDDATLSYYELLSDILN
ncbi:MAG: hypothetical protein IJE62_00745 [Clostridia bacterium]|nr:hypothetical protein [Clostridia bacterium]